MEESGTYFKGNFKNGDFVDNQGTIYYHDSKVNTVFIIINLTYPYHFL